MPSLKRVKIDTSQEKNLLTGLITSDKFMKEIVPILNVKDLNSGYSRRVARWCIDYYNKYNQAPKKEIQKIFSSRIRKEKIPEEEEGYITEFLNNLSKRYSKLSDYNETFYLDESEKYLAERKVKILLEDAEDALIGGDIEKAETLVADFMRVKRSRSSSVDIVRDIQEVILALNYDDDVIFRYPGALGHVIGDVLRGDFFSFMAPMKRGKTWWLENFALRCLFRRLKVLFFTLEMPKNQVIRRFMQMMTAETKRAMEIKIPRFDDDNVIQHDMVKKEGISSKKVLKRLNEIKSVVAGGQLRVISRPSQSTNVADIKQEMFNLAHYDDFFPDVIVVDYADILAPEKGSGKDSRERVNDTWLALRGMAQEINGLVVTATQGNRATFKVESIEEDNTSEDIRKLAHVTHMATLNQTRQQKKDLVMRLGTLVARENEFYLDNEAVVLYQYAIGQCCLDSRLKSECDYEFQE